MASMRGPGDHLWQPHLVQGDQLWGTINSMTDLVNYLYNSVLRNPATDFVDCWLVSNLLVTEFCCKVTQWMWCTMILRKLLTPFLTRGCFWSQNYMELRVVCLIGLLISSLTENKELLLMNVTLTGLMSLVASPGISSGPNFIFNDLATWLNTYHALMFADSTKLFSRTCTDSEQCP